MERLHLMVKGRVQGVYFRASTQEIARALGLVGFVRNLPDGRVEVLAEGTRSQLDALLRFCREGPSAARVDNIDIEWQVAEEDLGASFKITG